jgi:hypothetical protein
MYDGDDSDTANLKSICGMLFFGVPNQGMPVDHWTPMIQDQSNRFFIEQLGRSSDILKVYRDKFPEVFPFKDSKIYSFYETKKSPTIKIAVSWIWPFKRDIAKTTYRVTASGN